jgi:hypothetical protein
VVSGILGQAQPAVNPTLASHLTDRSDAIVREGPS